MIRFNPDKYAKSILIKIIIDALSEHLSSRPLKTWTCAHCGCPNPDMLHLFEELNPVIFSLLENLDLSNKFANNEIKNFLTSAFRVMAPPKQYVEEKLKNETEVIESTGDAPFAYINKARASFYEQILRLA